MLQKSSNSQEFVGPFTYQAKSWDRSEKLYAKVEHLAGKGMNVRYFAEQL